MIGTTYNVTVCAKRNDLQIACTTCSPTDPHDLAPRNGCICNRVVATGIVSERDLIGNPCHRPGYWMHD